VYQEQYKGLALKHADYASDHVVSLPMSPYLTEEDQDKVIAAVQSSV
jgi:dTDP-4-amino-4,6-dideoxygalactose transaminase